MSRSLSRRTFVRGLAATSVVAAAGWRPALAAAPARQAQRELAGASFDLAIGETAVNLTGRSRVAQTINGSLPGPLLRFREGDTVALRVRNQLDEPTSIHWHGLILPFQMDGVPGVSFPGIRAGASFTYEFPVRQSGTYWYHSHSGLQELMGLYAPIVIDPRSNRSDFGCDTHPTGRTTMGSDTAGALFRIATVAPSSSR